MSIFKKYNLTGKMCAFVKNWEKADKKIKNKQLHVSDLQYL
jgi:hypothetical protein